MFDVIVIGAGPAGVEASLYLKRANLNILVLYNDKTSLNKAKIENYYGFLETDGNILYNKGIEQLNKLNINNISLEVIKLEHHKDFIKVYTINQVFESKYLILAMGLPLKLDDKFNKFLGIGVSLCAHCDGPFYKNKKINVSGKEPYLTPLIEELKIYSNNINIIDFDEIKELKGTFSLEKIILNNGDNIEIDNLFLALPLTSKKLLFEFGLTSDKDGYIKVDEHYKTNLLNVYSIGDSINGIHQIASAIYSGMVSALEIIKDNIK